MLHDMPEIITRYLRIASAADAADADRIVACFTGDAEVLDEDATHHGHDAIRRWWEGPATAFDYTVELRGSRDLDDGRHVVFSRLRGTFLGGVADLANRFSLRDGLITRLEIVPVPPAESVDGSDAI